MQFKKTAWRAMVLKDNDGDVGILVAGWVGIIKGVKGVPPKGRQ